ncbi:hypothetical protein [Mucilaginibacter sp. CSA2-8R]|uniref:hypothetical protein n=1 Tax=Mucilaginibacter sp. CSA2-8R TaxID=3141542 RepID=UPI00315DA47B
MTPDNEQQILEFIYQKILERDADNIVIKGHQVKYKGSTSSWRQAIFNGVDNGEFKLVCRNKGWLLSYKVYTKTIFYVALTLSVGAGVVLGLGEGEWWVGLLVFSFAYGFNRAINWVRHDILVEDVAWGIDTVFCVGQRKIKKEDSEKLKSWF